MSVGAGSIKRAAKSALTADAAGNAAEKGKKARTKTAKAEAAGQDVSGKKSSGKKAPETEDTNQTCQVGQPLPVHLL